MYYADVLGMRAIERLRMDWCGIGPCVPASAEEEMMARIRACMSVHSKTGKPFSASAEEKRHSDMPEDLISCLETHGADVANFVFDGHR